MIERFLLEKLIRRQRSFTIRPVPAPFEEWHASFEDKPIFHVMLRADDVRMINNLSMTVEWVSAARTSAKVAFRESKIPYGDALKINLSQIQSRDGLIVVGKFGEIACDGIDSDGRINFYMCLPMEIDVHSREHRTRKLEQVA